MDSNEHARALTSFTVVCNSFGVPLALDKTDGPNTRMTFLGLVIDTMKQKIQVPSDKIATVMDKLDNALSKRKLTLRELQFFWGIFNFICKALHTGCAFLHRLFD